MERTLMEATDTISAGEFGSNAKAWLATIDIPAIPREESSAMMVRRRWQKQLYEAGWLGVDWPTECGGQGLSAMHQLAVMQALINARAPFPASNINLYVVGPTLCSWGTPEQKERYLRPLL